MFAAKSPIERWALDPHVVHLNHGSFGGCPRAVVEAAEGWRARVEAAPMRFFVLEWQSELDRARAALAEMVRAPADRLAFVPGATAGLALALCGVDLEPGDHIITTDHAYRACTNQLVRLSEARGVMLDRVHVPLPFDDGATIDAIARAITPHTRLAVIDHITSPTALRLPIESIVALLARHEITVVIDGAHAPGQIELDVERLFDRGVTWYVGNCHKWLCGPKGSGFVVVASPTTPLPLVTSHGASPEYGPANRLHAELDWSGTHDPSAQLAVPTALATVAAEGGGWPSVIARNHALAIEMQRRLVDALGCPPIAPDHAVGAMAALPIELPPNTAPLDLARRLLAEGWEVPIVDFASGPLVRVSAHLYNDAAQATALARKLHALGVRGRRLR